MSKLDKKKTDGKIGTSWAEGPAKKTADPAQKKGEKEMQLKGLYLGKKEMVTKKGNRMEIHDIYTEGGLVRVMSKVGEFANIKLQDQVQAEVSINSLTFLEGVPKKL